MPDTKNRAVRGVLGEKLGMTQVFDDRNRVIPVTVVKAGPCVVTEVRTAEKDGYSAVQLAFGAIDPRKVTKPVAGHYRKAGVPPRRHLVELRTITATEYELGQEVGADGTQRKHRSPGSIGACATPARVFKGVRMAGRMGNVKTTTLSLTVHAVDTEKGLLLIMGAVPGPTGGLVLVRTAVKGGAR